MDRSGPRAKHWCFALNKYTRKDLNLLATLPIHFKFPKKRSINFKFIKLVCINSNSIVSLQILKPLFKQSLSSNKRGKEMFIHQSKEMSVRCHKYLTVLRKNCGQEGVAKEKTGMWTRSLVRPYLVFSIITATPVHSPHCMCIGQIVQSL